MAVTADAVLATAPRMLAMMTVSAVMVSKVQVTSDGLKGTMEEVELGVQDKLPRSPHEGEDWRRARPLPTPCLPTSFTRCCI